MLLWLKTADDGVLSELFIYFSLSARLNSDNVKATPNSRKTATNTESVDGETEREKENVNWLKQISKLALKNVYVHPSLFDH